MKCNDVKKFIYVYLDEEFDKVDTLAFEAHLRDCDDCRALCRFEEHFRRRLRNQLKANPAPATLKSRIMLSLDAPPAMVEPARQSALGWPAVRWMPVALAASVATLVLWPYSTATDGTQIDAAGMLMKTARAGTGEAAKTEAPTPVDETSQLEANVIEEALESHQVDPPLDVVGDAQTVGRYIVARARVPMMAPLPETADTRLVGVRLLRTGMRPTAMFTYDHLGRRMTVVQKLVQRQSCPLERMPLAARVAFKRAGGLNVAVLQSEGVVTAVVSDMTENDLAAVIPSNYTAAWNVSP